MLFERDRDFLGEADADEAAGGDGVAMTHEAHRFLGADDLSLFRGTQIGQCGMVGHRSFPHFIDGVFAPYPLSLTHFFATRVLQKTGRSERGGFVGGGPVR